MLVAHDGLPARDFPWLGDDRAPVETTAADQDERGAFYRGLASDFADAATPNRANP